jgi:DNA-directed RNA polymerase subunit RPC12/RpoP
MATTIAISCPKCEKQIKAPAELAGKKIRCKDCQHVFVVPVPTSVKAAPAGKGGKGEKGGKPGKAPAGKGDKAAKPAPKKVEVDEDDQEANPYGVTTESLLPRCPYCAKELEDDSQVICLNCGYNMQTRERIQHKKTFETTGGDQFVWLLPGILCALGVLAMIGAIVVFWTLFRKLEKDYDNDWWSIFFGLWARIWGTVICLFIGFFLGKFAVKRLILNPTAPEKEKHK